MSEIVSAGEMEHSLRQRLPEVTLSVWHRNHLEGMEYYEIEYSIGKFYGTFSMMCVFIDNFRGDPVDFVEWRIERDIAKATKAAQP